MLKRINLLFFLLISFISYSQKKGSITIKKEGNVHFYREGYMNDSLITKNVSDIFIVDVSNDKKDVVEIKLNNATLLKTKNAKEFKLVYTPGMKYRMVYVSDNAQKLGTIDRTFEPKISTDGATTGKKEIEVEIWDTKLNSLILKNIFYFKSN